MDKEPTKEQIREFWEWCGFEQIDYLDTSGKVCGTHWVHSLAIGGGCSKLPPIDLNNLFKYPVLKLLGGDNPSSNHRVYNILLEWIKGVVYNREDPALALFWAFYKVLEVNDEHPLFKI